MSDLAPVDPTLAALRTRLPRLVEDLAELVAVESPFETPRATAASADAVTALGSRLLGSAPERHGAHLVWSHGPTRVLLVGHHDTVWPVGTLARWPFQVDGDRATGPGCFDMKAGLVQLFHALTTLPSLDGVTVVVNGDEEVGSPDSRVLIERAARGARAALICEPSADGALKTARKGIARYRLEIAGRAAHAGLDPGRGVNAGVELAHQILAVAGLGDGDTTVTPTVLSGGSTDNTVPAAAGVAVDVRAFHQAEFERVDRAMQGLRPVLAGSRVTVHGGVHRPALPPTASARLYGLARTVAAELGLAPLAGVAVGGASDGNLTAGYGIPTLDGLGPVGGNAHAEGEWVDLPAMAERAALLAALVDRVLRTRAWA
ncbi:glutamate carboxypeptidase [Catellatospora methionotrophica]|uniref:Glutamate carboxypeptidase n=1 Tax=Catellatospora methionotrophica TaxID=121620 RepID=A0A8J3PJT6_9ACTN|nr:M20 family metallopeptidase [Catellatospora methionotrophica]GIG19159.1 glutamate carboxypeptidase [Catellatospora methionotrophica]